MPGGKRRPRKRICYRSPKRSAKRVTKNAATVPGKRDARPIVNHRHTTDASGDSDSGDDTDQAGRGHARLKELRERHMTKRAQQSPKRSKKLRPFSDCDSKKDCTSVTMAINDSVSAEPIAVVMDTVSTETWKSVSISAITVFHQLMENNIEPSLGSLKGVRRENATKKLRELLTKVQDNLKSVLAPAENRLEEYTDIEEILEEKLRKQKELIEEQQKLADMLETRGKQLDLLRKEMREEASNSSCSDNDTDSEHCTDDQFTKKLRTLFENDRT